MTTRTPVSRGLIAAISSISITGFSAAFMVTLLSLELARRGVSSPLIGLQVAAMGVANLAAAAYAPRLLKMMNPRQIIIIAICIMALLLPAYFYVENVWLWFPMRMLGNFFLTSAFVASEFWLTSIAPENRRGFIMSTYSTCLAIGFALGPATLVITGTQGLLPYLLGALILLCGLLPQLLPSPALPQIDKKEQPSNFFAIARQVPLVIFAAFTFGAIISSDFSFLPIWGVRSNLPESEAALLMAALDGGAILLQMPIGLLSDRMNKLSAMLLCLLISGASLFLIPFFVTDYWLLYPLLVLHGGASTGIYTMALAMLGDKFSGAQLASANAALIFAYSLGMIAAPPITGAAMEISNPNGYVFLLSTLIFLLAGLLIGRRLLKNKEVSLTVSPE